MEDAAHILGIDGSTLWRKRKRWGAYERGDELAARTSDVAATAG
jgi:hypothetical protein